MTRYLEAIRKAEAHFRSISIRSIPQADSSQSDALAKAVAMGKDPPIGTFLETLHQPTARALDETVVAILPIEAANWRAPLLSFLRGTEELDDPIALHRIQHHARGYHLINGAL